MLSMRVGVHTRLITVLGLCLLFFPFLQHNGLCKIIPKRQQYFWATGIGKLSQFAALLWLQASAMMRKSGKPELWQMILIAAILPFTSTIPLIEHLNTLFSVLKLFSPYFLYSVDNNDTQSWFILCCFFLLQQESVASVEIIHSQYILYDLNVCKPELHVCNGHLLYSTITVFNNRALPWCDKFYI